MTLPAFTSPASMPEWKALQKLAASKAEVSVCSLFSAAEHRFRDCSLSAGGLLLDYSKQRIDEQVRDALLGLARACSFEAWRDALFSGAQVNESERRAACHWRLRDPSSHPAVAEQLARLEGMVTRVHAGHWRGAYGDAIEDVVNIGVGGSELGPLMACHALNEERPSAARVPRIHFVSSMDGGQIHRTLKSLNPRTTLFIISSKSFSTVDTLSNARTARAWLASHLPDDASLVGCHFIGISAHAERMNDWGIPPENQLLLWDWVGGRFSLWSAIGLPVALAAGVDAFRELLAGACSMDAHFREQQGAENIPLMLALIDIWNVNFLDIRARAVLPYDSRLKGLPVYLEQLEMESNGKSVDRSGAAIDYHTCPVIWGEVGPNAQHAFYQLLHQGTQPVSCEFVAVAGRGGDFGPDALLGEQHKLSLANCLAQSRLLAFGDDGVSGLDSHQRYRGNQPCTTLILDDMSPRNLGMLLAAYEHKVFAASVIWGINPFDQWGVELGKRYASELFPVIDGQHAMPGSLDASTRGLLQHIRSREDQRG